MMKKIRNNHVKIAFIVVIAAAVLYAIVSVIDNIGLVYESIVAAVSFILQVLAPVLIGFVIAFILRRPSMFFARLISRIKFFSRHKKGAQGAGVFITFVLFIAAIAAFFALMVPGIIQSIDSITKEIPGYASSVDAFLGDLSKTEGISPIFEFVGIDIAKANSISSIISEFWQEIMVMLKDLAGTLFGFIINTGLFLYNFVLGIIFSVYMLLFKDEIKGQLRTLSQNVFQKSHYKLMFLIDIADDMFYRFIVGKGILSIAVGIVTFIVCSILGFKYTPLISIIIAVTNMIPTFGPFIGAIPAILLSLMTAPIFALYMVFIILGLQVLDGYILGPRVFGESMGINGFWIMFSIIVFGALFGVAGMLVAVPVFGIVRILIKNWLYRRKNGTLEGEAEFDASIARYRQWTVTKRRKKKDENNKPTEMG